MQRWEQVLDYWFGSSGEVRSDLWFGRNDDLDAEIREQFVDDLERARDGLLDEWAATARGRLALIVLIDQFSRNIHRDSARAYAGDRKAQELCIAGIERGVDRRLGFLERWFFYMPLMHAESMDLQERSMHCFKQLCDDAPPEHQDTCAGVLDFARRHRDVIVRFGRFPHRNEVLGRASTSEELEYLAAGKWF